MNVLMLIGFFVTAFPAEASEWNSLTHQENGWLAADGIYSIRVPETSEATGQKSVWFFFSDTFCGTTKNGGQEFDRVFMVNHSFWRVSEEGMRAFVPEKGKNLLPDRYWLQDGTFYGDRLHFTGMIPDHRTWKPRRIDWISLGFLRDGTPDWKNVRIWKDVPLLWDSPDRAFVFGAAFLEDAGDGFFYVFGYLDQKKAFSRKDLAAARVPKEKLTDFSKWRFWNGKAWVSEITESAPLAESISPEFSISRIPSGPCAGKFLLVCTRGGISPYVEYRIGETPIGPFGEGTIFWTAPEHKDGISAYNSKGHPAISTKEELTVTYNLNRLGHLPRKPEEYRPRFLTLKYADLR